MRKVSRRDFLKMATLFAGSAAASSLTSGGFTKSASQGASAPNILIILFDAMSATNLSLYGYPRETTPNLQRLAGRATVYHQHYSPGNFTTPGTASLLTGLYPWTHRAINQGGLIARRLTHDNLFRGVGPQHQRLAFSQNPWPNYFFGQFREDVERIVRPTAFGLMRSVYGEEFDRDLAAGYRAFDDFLFQDGMPPASLLIGVGARLQGIATRPSAEEDASGLTLRRVFDGVLNTVERLQPPWLAYLHLFPPHAPYRPSGEFAQRFNDGWEPPRKPSHRLVDPRTHRSPESLNELRQTYDAYIANLDAEFARVFEQLESKGILDHSHVVVTSDHGEFFERGEQGHLTPLLYEPVVRVPLVIWSPGQTARRDVFAPTNNIDVLPTLVQLAGGQVPDWCEGELLPALGGEEEPQRSLFMMEAQTNSAFKPFSRASFAMRKGRYKLIDYMGYPQYRVKHRFEMYDLEEDPEELNNLYSETMSAARDMKEELLQRIVRSDAKLSS